MTVPDNYESIEHAHLVVRPSGDTCFMHFHPDTRGVKLYGTRDPIHLVRVMVAKDDDDSRYWGWYDAEDRPFRPEGPRRIVMIYPDRALLGICFTYGLKAAEEAGQGIAVRVKVEDLGMVEEAGK